MTTHELKTHPEYFDQVWNGNKRFEIRRNDRNFKVGDMLKLLEYDPYTDKYSGRVINRKVLYILYNGDDFGLKPGFCIISF